jgi:hypothetical protein
VVASLVLCRFERVWASDLPTPLPADGLGVCASPALTCLCLSVRSGCVPSCLFRLPPSCLHAALSNMSTTHSCMSLQFACQPRLTRSRCRLCITAVLLVCKPSAYLFACLMSACLRTPG